MASILAQPGCSCIRIHRRCCFTTLKFFSSRPFASRSHPPHHFSHRPLRKRFALDVSRSLSQSHRLLNTDAPTLHHFIAQASLTASQPQPHVLSSDAPNSGVTSKGRIYHETYGCQMNINDMEIVLSIMKNAGYTETVDAPESAEIIFINTCAIRDNAEQKVWQRLNYFWFLKRRWKNNVAIGRSLSLHPPKVVVLGCMAERLKDKILDADKMVDVVCGPDAYRDLPRLLEEVDYGQKGINTLLSLEETYADISPVRISKNLVTAFVSVMRGCNNMCSFCIVPFTRGRERSRPVESIVKEVGELWEEGVKEVTLLGQNVNSYNDASGSDKEFEPGSNWELSDGFKSMCKVKNMGLRFADLLDRLSTEFPEMRFRYTSPHPKDFPDELLYLMHDRHNICKYIHLPAQTGSTTVLERMRRGYSREAYLELVQKIRRIIPDVGISSDFICGFCGETEKEHADTLSLIKAVGYDMAYMFAYSMREKTHAHRNYIDDVPEEVKQRRLTELIEAFRESTGQRYDSQVGTIQLVLVEGPNRRAPDKELIGKSDKGHRVAFVNLPLLDREKQTDNKRNPVVGDYVEVHITKSSFDPNDEQGLSDLLAGKGKRLSVEVLGLNRPSQLGFNILTVLAKNVPAPAPGKIPEDLKEVYSQAVAISRGCTIPGLSQSKREDPRPKENEVPTSSTYAKKNLSWFTPAADRAAQSAASGDWDITMDISDAEKFEGDQALEEDELDNLEHEKEDLANAGLSEDEGEEGDVLDDTMVEVSPANPGTEVVDLLPLSAPVMVSWMDALRDAINSAKANPGTAYDSTHLLVIFDEIKNARKPVDKKVKRLLSESCSFALGETKEVPVASIDDWLDLGLFSWNKILSPHAMVMLGWILAMTEIKSGKKETPVLSEAPKEKPKPSTLPSGLDSQLKLLRAKFSVDPVGEGPTDHCGLESTSEAETTPATPPNPEAAKFYSIMKEWVAVNPKAPEAAYDLMHRIGKALESMSLSECFDIVHHNPDPQLEEDTECMGAMMVCALGMYGTFHVGEKVREEVYEYVQTEVAKPLIVLEQQVSLMAEEINTMTQERDTLKQTVRSLEEDIRDQESTTKEILKRCATAEMRARAIEAELKEIKSMLASRPAQAPAAPARPVSAPVKVAEKAPAKTAAKKQEVRQKEAPKPVSFLDRIKALDTRAAQEEPQGQGTQPPTKKKVVPEPRPAPRVDPPRRKQLTLVEKIRLTQQNKEATPFGSVHGFQSFAERIANQDAVSEVNDDDKDGWAPTHPGASELGFQTK